MENSEFLRSSFTQPSKRGAAVAVRRLPDGSVHVRRGNDGTVLFFTEEEWSAFLLGVRNYEFDPQ